MTLPMMYRIRQELAAPELSDIDTAVTDAVASLGDIPGIRPGDRIAVTAGSRGIYGIDRILFRLVRILEGMGARPFLVPAMGSHGGGTAEGQLTVLASLGITEKTMGCPILSSMETVAVATSSHGFPVLVDRNAAAADGIVVVNRIKPHTEFEGPIESGLMKMMAIGLGKHAGCFQVHKQTVHHGYREVIPEIGALILKSLPVRFGLGIVENRYDRPAMIQAVQPEAFAETEARMLKTARDLMARLPVDRVDVLIVDEMGKNISGTGIDTNVIGRIMFIGESEPEKPVITRIVVLGLTPESHGNAIGIGLADFTTEAVAGRLDLRAMATNAIAAMTPEKGRIPIAMPNDRDAVGAAFDTIGAVPPEEARVIHIRNTLDLAEMRISEALKPEVSRIEGITFLDDPHPLEFDPAGRLAPLKKSG